MNIPRARRYDVSTTLDVILLVYPDFADITRNVARMTLAQRSAIIKCCQAQCTPLNDKEGTVLSRILIEAGQFVPHNSRRAMRVLEFCHQINSLIEGRVSSSVILDICRSTPVASSHILEAQLKSWNKEIICCETESRPLRINWRVIFEGVDEPILPGVRRNPGMAFAFRSSFVRWRSQLQGKVLYPRMTRKNMSWDTRRNFEQYFGRQLNGVPIFSQVMWQRCYAETGIEIQGISEMRQKWYPSNAKPRTYYAQGGTHYQSSCYLQDVFTALVNSNPITHHVSRLQPTRLILPNDGHYLIYDLTSFTSRMWEQKSFTRHLGEFLAGVEVLLMDPRKGPVFHDLGDLVHSYNDICNIHPQVSYERFAFELEGHIAEHASASMLGIYGNLMTCTMAHAACVAQAADNESEVNVAGDDAQIIDRRQEEADILIRAVGDYEPDKTFRSDERGAICLKRPIQEEGSRLLTKTNCVAPNVILTSHYLFDITDPRYTFFQQDSTDDDSISIIGKDLMRFLRSVYRSRESIDISQVQIAFDIASTLTRLGPGTRQGGLPNCGDSYFWPYIPNEAEDLLIDDPLHSLILQRFRGEFIMMPVHESLERVDLEVLSFNEPVRTNSDRHLSFLEKLGFIEKEDVMEPVRGDKAFRRIVELFDGSEEPAVIEVVLLKEIPVHLLYPF